MKTPSYIVLLLLFSLVGCFGCSTTTVPSGDVEPAVTLIASPLADYLNADQEIDEIAKESLLDDLSDVQSALQADEIDIGRYGQKIRSVAVAYEGYIGSDAGLGDFEKRTRLRTAALLKELVDTARSDE